MLTIPEVPIHSVCTGPVRDVLTRFTKIQKYFCKKGPRSAIKLNWLYGATWPFSGGQLAFFEAKRVATSRSLFNPSVPYRADPQQFSCGFIFNRCMHATRSQNLFCAPCGRNRGPDRKMRLTGPLGLLHSLPVLCCSASGSKNWLTNNLDLTPRLQNVNMA